MPNIGTFDLRKVNVIFGVAKITGYAEGDSISVDEKNDAFVSTVGADGHTDRVKNNANQLEIVITLTQTSNTNQILSALHTTDRAVGVPLPLIIKDGNGTTLIGATSAWIKKFPKTTFGNEAKTREWTIHTSGDYLINIGGNS